MHRHFTLGFLLFFCLLSFPLDLVSAPPTIPATNLSFNLVDGDRLRLTWTSGDGARRIVVVREGAPVSGLPANGTDYNANSAFGVGDLLAPGEYVVYDATGSSALFTSLNPSTTYHVAIFEYNGSSFTTEYLTSGVGTAAQATLSAPSVQTSGIAASDVTGNSARLDWVAGNGDGRLILLKAGSPVDSDPVDLNSYSGNSAFGFGTQVGTGNYAVYSFSGTFINLTNLSPGTTYHWAAYEYNGSSGRVFLRPGSNGSFTTGTTPTIAASNLTFSLIDGNRLRLQWTRGNGARRIVVAKANGPVTATPSDGVDYNASLDFGAGDTLAPGEFVVYDNTGTNALVRQLAPGTPYHFTVFEYNGSGTNTFYQTVGAASLSQATLSAPTVQAGGLMFSNVTGNSMQVNWTNGDGNGRLLLAKAGSPVDANPVDLSTYSGSSTFGNGSEIGTGNYVVYNFSGSSLTLTNLNPATTNHFALFEYNGSSGPIYLSPGSTASQATGGAPTVAASNLSFILVDGNRLRLNWTRGDGARRLVVMKQGSPVTAVPADNTGYTASTNFGSGDQLAPGEFVVYDGTGSSTLTSQLSPATTYHYAIFEYNGSGATSVYQQTGFATTSGPTASAPTVQGSGLAFSNLTGNSMTVDWTNGNGSRRILLAKAGSPVDADPVDLSLYSSSSTFGNGSEIGTANYVVYNLTGSSLTLTNLNPGVTYHFALYEYNGSSGPVYLTPGARASQTTAGAPTVGATFNAFSTQDGDRLRANWTRGNGSRVLVVAKAGSPVTATPTDGSSYSASAILGNGDALAAGEFVVYDGTGSNVLITNLQPATTYHFAAFEYNGSGGSSLYQQTGFGTTSQATLSAPTVQTGSVQLNNPTPSTLDVSWTNGNGSNRLVIAKAGGAVDVPPTDGNAYPFSNAFGGGTDLGGGNFVVYQGSGTAFTLTNLTPNVIYHLAIYEFNGAAFPLYLQPGAVASASIVATPTVQASNLNFSQVGSDEMALSWTNGDGSRRLVLAKAGAAVDSEPVDATGYPADATFGNGSELGSGNFVVYAGTASNVTVSGLSSGTTYHFAVFEYGGQGPDAIYLRPGLPGSQATVTAPSLAPSNLTFPARTGSSITAGWTNGNGSGRLVVVTQGAALTALPGDGVNYIANSSYGGGDALGNGFVVYQGSGTSVNVTNLLAGTVYHFYIFEYAGTSSAPAFNLSSLNGSELTLGAPAIQASNVQASNVAASSLTLTWDNGGGQRRLVAIRAGAAVAGSPVDGTAYTPNTFFGTGDPLDPFEYVVYASNGSSVTVTNLQPSTSYEVAVFEFNGTGTGTLYNRTSPARLAVSTQAGGFPVEWLSFEAESWGQEVRLRWTTASELNNDYFAVERSLDGLSWEQLGRVAGAGTSSEAQLYEYRDRVPHAVGSYYRLKQVDFDGQFSFSAVVRWASQAQEFGWQVYPNPVQDRLQVVLPVGSWQLQLLDAQGRVVQASKTQAGTLSWSLRSLPAGTYWLSAGTDRQRIAVQAIRKE
jgi:hypothetical protein